MKKSFIVLALTLSLSAASFAGCGVQGTSFDTDSTESAASGSGEAADGNEAASAEHEVSDAKKAGNTETASDSPEAAAADSEETTEESSDSSADQKEKTAGEDTAETDNAAETTETESGDAAEEEDVLTPEAAMANLLAMEELEVPEELPEERSIYQDMDVSQITTVSTQIDPAILNNYTIGNEGEGIAPTLIDNEVMKIAILGDSQFGNFKYFDGMAYLLSQYCRADVYNLAIGGSSACTPVEGGAPDGSVHCNTTGVAMADAILGKIPLDFLKMYPYVYNLFTICDFDDIDVFVVEYGVNDYLSDFPISRDSNYEFDYYSYRQAIGYITDSLIKRFPNCKVFVCSPGYAQFFSNGGYAGDSNVLSNRYGTLFDYVNACNNVITTRFDPTRVGLMNPYYMLNVTGVNGHEYLLDGIHMNRAGREQYAQLLARLIIRAEGYLIGEGENPLEVDWISTKQN